MTNGFPPGGEAMMRLRRKILRRASLAQDDSVAICHCEPVRTLAWQSVSPLWHDLRSCQLSRWESQERIPCGRCFYEL